MAKQGSQDVYITIPNSWEWLIVNYVVNAVGAPLLTFYIFKGLRMWEDYIKLCRPRTCMVMHKKVWMAIYLFKQWLTFLYISILGRFFKKHTSFDPWWVTRHYSSTWTNNITWIGHGDFNFTYTCHMCYSHWTSPASSPSRMLSKNKKIQQWQETIILNLTKSQWLNGWTRPCCNPWKKKINKIKVQDL